MSNYNINPVSRAVNNICESIFVPNPTYIQPIPTYVPPPTPEAYFPPPQPLQPLTTYTSPSYPLPTVTYTPETLRSSFAPLNSNYANTFYGR